MLDRLIGLETEYLIRFQSDDASRPSDRDLFDQLLDQLDSQIPTAAAEGSATGKVGVFLANGGAVWFETRRPASGIGLVEGSTPECRSPRALLAQQRAMDRLLAESARRVSPDRFFLLKNCRDSRGTAYGAQENYEATLATGWRLTLWRIGAGCLIGFHAVLLLALVVPLFLVLVAFNGLILAPLILWACQVSGRPASRELKMALYGRGWFTKGDADSYLPPWIEPPIESLMRLLLVPSSLFCSLLVMLMPLHQTQRRLLPFLLTRTIWAGAGWIDRQGQFQIAEKATSRTRVLFHMLLDHDRPIFGLGQFLKPSLMALFHRPSIQQLFHDRQRIQVSIGDSNLCEEAEYLRIGATALVLDAIEAGAITPPPSPRWALRTLGRISRDSNLTNAYPLWRGRSMTAVQIQRWYLNACRRHVHEQEQVSDEVWDLLSRWSAVLDDLEDNREALLGRVDWITKQMLLERAGADLPAESRKKIDLRYHELSPEGYWSQLAAAGLATGVVADEEIQYAMRWPPAGTRAMERGRMIREFYRGDEAIVVSWGSIKVGSGPNARVIPLSPESDGADSRPTPASVDSEVDDEDVSAESE